MRIEGPGRPLAPAGKPASRRAASGFAVAETPDTQAAEAAATDAAAPLVAIGPLAAPDEPDAVADRQAAAHGAALLDAMAGLQQALIDGDPAQARTRLAGLAEHTPGAADPGLDRVLQAVAQRAAVELAKTEGG